MEEKRINVVVGRDGRLEISTEGYVGSDCLKATEKLEAVLGEARAEDRTFHPEFHQAPANVQEQTLSW